MQRSLFSISVSIVLLGCLLSTGGCGNSKQVSQTVKVGYGASAAKDLSQAVNEAVSQMMSKLKSAKPDFVVLFSTVGFDAEQVLKGVRQGVGLDAKIYGGTSCLAVFATSGYFQGEVGSLALLGIKSDKIKFGIGSADLDKLPAEAAGKLAITAAIKNAGHAGEIPDVILMTSAPGQEESILRGIAAAVGPTVPVMGGSAGDNTIEGKWSQFGDTIVLKNGVVLTAVFSGVKFGIGYESGYKETDKKGIVTKAEGRTIFSIDNKPAAEVYNNWVDGTLNDVLKTGGSILNRTAYFPLCKIIRSKEDPEFTKFLLSVHPASFKLPEKALTVFAEIQKGEEVMLTKGTEAILMNRASSTPKLALALGDIKNQDVAFSIYTYCAGTMLALKPESRTKLPQLVNQELTNKPFIGNFGFGEQGFLLGLGNLHGNLVSSVIVFSNQEKPKVK